jgi:polyisoprenoid-binding protein YceI
MRATAALLCGAGLLCVALAARAAEWRFAPQASRLGFSATLEQGPADGEFARYSAELRFSPDAPDRARLVVTVDTASADMHDGEMNAALASPAWLDAGAHPQARFAATSIEAHGAGRFLAHGRLRLKGSEQPLVVPFAWHEIDGVASMIGEFTISRTAHGVGTGEWGGTEVVADLVVVQFELGFDAAP